jgi:hypothetical protein
VQRGNSLKLRILMEAFQPDAIVCTQAHPFAVLSAYARRQGKPIPLWGVVTDFLPHRFWHVPPDERIRYVVPTETAVQRLMILGTPADRIATFGIPIQADVLAARGKTVSRTDGRRILVMGGSRGLGARFASNRQLDRAAADFTIDSSRHNRPCAAKRPARLKFRHPIRIRATSRSHGPHAAAPADHRQARRPDVREAMASCTPMRHPARCRGQERGTPKALRRRRHPSRPRPRLAGSRRALLPHVSLLDMMAARAGARQARKPRASSPRPSRPSAARGSPRP